MASEFTCKACGHSFNKLVSAQSSEVRCPRCGGPDLEPNRYLLGTPNADEVTLDDYCDVALAPCCTPDWKGWRNILYATSFCSALPDPSVCQPKAEEETEKRAEKSS